MIPLWSRCKKILCIRLDNMGDVLMSYPAIRSLKRSTKAHITLLTSASGAPIVPFLPDIDETVVFNPPWAKEEIPNDWGAFLDSCLALKAKAFDAAVVFTVYSQNPMPAIVLMNLVGIPLRLSYCRENPYHLLTHWIPDPEPYSVIKHQVERDMHLVREIGVFAERDGLEIVLDPGAKASIGSKMRSLGTEAEAPYIVLHPGVSEKKREYAAPSWKELVEMLGKAGLRILLTGNAADDPLTRQMAGHRSINLAGSLTVGEWIHIIEGASLVITVNSAAAHIAAATQTPIIVLYALTNPQHLPWQGMGRAFFFDVPESLSSQNQVVQYVRNERMIARAEFTVNDIFTQVQRILSGRLTPIQKLALR